jgi:hypothetical protein
MMYKPMKRKGVNDMKKALLMILMVFACVWLAAGQAEKI